MNLSPIALWASLQSLPWFFSIFVFSVVLLAACLLFLLPLYYLLRSEPRVLSQWAREHYATVVTRPAQYGAQAGELFFGKLSFLIDVVCVVVGRLVAWLAIFMAVMQFVVVIMRYVFAYGSIQMQESIWYMHGVLFMAGAAYALFLDEHVRVDIFYSNMSVKKRAWIDLLGSIFFLIPLCLTTWWFAWGYVANSWAVMETSTEGSGLPYIYLFKTVILLFAGLVLLQAISVVIRSARKLFGHSLMVESAETGGY